MICRKSIAAAGTLVALCAIAAPAAAQQVANRQMADRAPSTAPTEHRTVADIAVISEDTPPPRAPVYVIFGVGF